MTKKDFAKLLAEKGIFESKVAAERKLDAIFGEIETLLISGESVNFIGFGKWEVVERAERLGRNPKTKEEIKIAAKKAIKFKSGKKLDDMINA
ncbi:MAG: HU family DNA-binding protein [Fusobacteriaceae bacterium]